jgi:hypothetical protein
VVVRVRPTVSQLEPRDPKGRSGALASLEADATRSKDAPAAAPAARAARRDQAYRLTPTTRYAMSRLGFTLHETESGRENFSLSARGFLAVKPTFKKVEWSVP